MPTLVSTTMPGLATLVWGSVQVSTLTSMLESILGSMGLVHHLEITVKGDGSANQDNSVQMCPDKSATMFQQLSVNKFKIKSALKCQEQFVMKLRTTLRPNVSWFTKKVPVRVSRKVPKTVCGNEGGAGGSFGGNGGVGGSFGGNGAVGGSFGGNGGVGGNAGAGLGANFGVNAGFDFGLNAGVKAGANGGAGARSAAGAAGLSGEDVDNVEYFQD